MADDAALASVIAFNDHLRALAGAGIPVGLGDQKHGLADVLDTAQRDLSVRTSLKQSVSDALAEDRELPAPYRHALTAVHTADDPTAALDLLCRRSLANQQFRRSMGYSLIHPLLLGGLAYLGLIAMCLWFAPTITEFYDEVRIDRSWSIRTLLFLKQTMAFWIPLVPISLGLSIWWWRRGWRSSPSQDPQDTNRDGVAARFADQLSLLLEAGIPLTESLQLAAGNVEGRELSPAFEAVVESAGNNDPPANPDSRLQLLPPLLRWALTTQLDEAALPDTLQRIAEMYRERSVRRTETRRKLAPVFVSALIGGAIALLFGLSLFSAYSSMLQDLAG